MIEEKDGAGQFSSVILRPKVTITPESNEVKATDLHEKAHGMCFIARSVNFPVETMPTVVSGARQAV